MEVESDEQSTNYRLMLEHSVAAIVTLLMLEQHSRMPEAQFLICFFAVVAVFGLGIVYFSRLLKSLRWKSEANRRSRALVHWGVFPVAVTMMLTSSATHWPASVRFYLSKASFEELISKAYSGQEIGEFPRWVGMYNIDRIYDSEFNYETRQGTIGFVTGVALIDECGLLYDSSNRESTHYLTSRIAPHWYVTEW